MLKSTAIALIMTALIFLTACGGDSKSNEGAQSGVSTPEAAVGETQKPTNGDSGIEDQNDISTNQPDAANFETGILFDMKSYHDQVPEDQALVYTALEKNLNSLVEQDKTKYRSGFINEKLADAMMVYYDGFKYRFTGIESIEPNPKNGNLHITVIGARLDTATNTVQDVKMLYAMGQEDNGEWLIHTID